VADIVKLDETILGAAASEITFTVSQAYQHLEWHLFGRGDTAATTIDVSIRLNSDTGSNYDSQYLRGSAATASAAESLGATSARIGTIPAASATASVAGGITGTLFDYIRTAWQGAGVVQNAHKHGTSSGNLRSEVSAVFWRDTSAVTSITFLPSAGNFDTNTRAAIYGYKASSLQTILGAAASEITISGIPQTGKMLRVMAVGRTARSAVTNDLRWRFNGDTANNYDDQQLYGSASSAGAAERLGASANFPGSWPGDTATAGVAGALIMDIHDYARTAWQKGWSALCARKYGTSSGNLNVFAISGFWRDTSAITSFSLFTGHNLKADTLVDVYVI